MTAAATALPTLPAPVPVWRRFFSFPNILTLLYLCIATPFLIAHPIWRDEAQAFLIARDSTSPLDVLHNLRFEGHPPLWHWLLWLLTRVTTSPEAMQYVHLALAAASVYIF